MRGSILAVALAAVVTCTGEAAAQTTFRVEAASVAPADEALAALRVEYAAAANAGDALRLSRLYADDAIAVPRDGVMLRGSAEIQRYSHEAFSSGPDAATVTLTPRHFESHGAVASETGTFSEIRSGKEHPAATGVYVAIYTRGADGAWRIAMEVRTTGREPRIVRW